MLRYALPSMTEAETRDYLTHHLKLVGRSDQLRRRVHPGQWTQIARSTSTGTSYIASEAEGRWRGVSSLAWLHRSGTDHASFRELPPGGCSHPGHASSKC